MQKELHPSREDGQCSDTSRFFNPLDYFEEVANALRHIPTESVEGILSCFRGAYEADRTIYVFGNGGSAALAQHFACDMGKGTLVSGKRRVRVVSLVDNAPLLTAWANDSAYEEVFAEQLLNLGRGDDVAFAISGSGNSPNVLKALKISREMGLRTAGLTGFNGGKMKELCDVCVVVPAGVMQLIEDIHLSVAHAISLAFRARIAAAIEGSGALSRAAAGML